MTKITVNLYQKKILSFFFLVIFIFYPFVTFANQPEKHQLLITKVEVINEENIDNWDPNYKPKNSIYNVKILDSFKSPDLEYDNYKVATAENLKTGDSFWLIGKARRTDETWTSQCMFFCLISKSEEECTAEKEQFEKNNPECFGDTELTIYPNFIFNLKSLLSLVVIFILLLVPLIYYRKRKSKIKRIL